MSPIDARLARAVLERGGTPCAILCQPPMTAARILVLAYPTYNTPLDLIVELDQSGWKRPWQDSISPERRISGVSILRFFKQGSGNVGLWTPDEFVTFEAELRSILIKRHGFDDLPIHNLGPEDHI